MLRDMMRYYELKTYSSNNYNDLLKALATYVLYKTLYITFFFQNSCKTSVQVKYVQV